MRSINEIIIHCTATHEGREVPVSEIDRWHRERGFNGIGYHYVIDLSGRIWNGRDEAEIGAHCQGHNSESIGIAYVGGLDAVTGYPKDTRTAPQKQSLERLIADVCSRYSITKISGHRQYANKDCPCFDVPAWLREIGL